MDIWKFGALLFTREVFAAGATSAYDLFFTDKSSTEKAAELQKVLKDSIDNFENAGAAVIGALIPIPGAADMIRGLVTSTAAEAWETTLTTIAAENIVAAVRPLFHLAQSSAKASNQKQDGIRLLDTSGIPPVKLKSEVQDAPLSEREYQNSPPLSEREYQPDAPLAPLGLQNTQAQQGPFVERRGVQGLDPFRYSEPHPTDPLNPAQPGPGVPRIEQPVTVTDIPVLPERRGGA